MADFADIAWGPVENIRHDLGIDVFLQVRDERRFDRAIFVMAQVKSGESYFDSEVKSEGGNALGWWYAESDARHFEDWVQHGSPHILVLHDPTTRTSYWAHVTKEDVVSTGEGFKIFVPAEQCVNDANREALLAVAATAKGAPALQGTSFTASAKAVAPGRALRHALLAPRLIAPHPNASRERVLEPEEAVALITLGRTSELASFLQSGRNPNLAAASVKSRAWPWRFYAAYRALVLEDDHTPIVELAKAITNRKPSKRLAHRAAACVVVSAVALVDRERLDDALSVLIGAGEDLQPIDHAWVLIHRAALLAERGELEAARTLAATAQRTVSLDADDVTASAIGAAAASLIFATSDWGSGQRSDELRNMLIASDTATAWWLSQTVLWAVMDHEKEAFDAWAHFDDIDLRKLGVAEARLRGAWFSAMTAGIRSFAKETLGVRARHGLVNNEVAWRRANTTHSASHRPRDDESESLHCDSTAISRYTTDLEESLDSLRRHGRDKDLQAASRRLWQAGPAQVLVVAAQNSIVAPWTHTNALAKLKLLEIAGDLLDVSLADGVVNYCVETIERPKPFLDKVRPTFSVSHFAYKALKGVLPAASDAAQKQCAEHLLQTVPEAEDISMEEALLRLLSRLRVPVVRTMAKQIHKAATDCPSPRLTAALLGVLLSAGDAEAESALLQKADGGDRYAVGELRDTTRLSPVAASALIEHEVAACWGLLEEAHQGSHSFGEWDCAGTLALANCTFPSLAQWEPVIEVVLAPEVAVDHKIGAIRVLARRAAELPAEVSSILRRTLSNGASIPGVEGLRYDSDAFSDASFALGLALGAADMATALRRILVRLRGSVAQRNAAAGLLASLGGGAQDAAIQGALAALTSDPFHHIRAAAAATLARGSRPPVSEMVNQAIVAAAGEAGCTVPLAVASALQSASAEWLELGLVREILSQHPSALVRTASQAGRS